MKPIKILTIIFILSFAVFPLYPQETAGDRGSSVVTDNQSKTGDGASADTPDKEAKETAVSTDSSDSGQKQISDDGSKSESPGRTVKKKAEAPVIQEEKAAAVDSSSSGDDYLLSINEGNFKYKRIPDIKLAEKSPTMADQNIQDKSADEGNTDNSAGNGFFGLSKSTADIVAKGGILLLVLGIFILYRVRSRSSGRRSSGSGVMNSYRK